MLAFGFFNPALLWALPLAAIPIIIHLLNRRRFKKVRWAAMEYLLRAMKRNRRRMQMEHWILLLLRTLAVMFLVFLVTRPQLTGSGLIQAKTHHVVLLDDSASMQQRAGVATLFKDGINQVNTLTERLSESHAGDLFTLVRSSQRQQPDLNELTINPQLGSRVREALAGLRCSASTLDIGKLLTAARKLGKASEKKASRTQYYVITDLRRQDWTDREGKPLTAVQQLVEFDEQREHLKILEVGKPQRSNVAVTAVRLRNRVAMAGAPVTLEVEVQNLGQDACDPFEVGVEIDRRVSRTLQVEALAAGEKRVVDLLHTFRDPGFHGIEAAIGQDVYSVDNKRALSLDVLPTSQVLLVDGDPNAAAGRSETLILATALDPSEDVGSISGITPAVIPEHALAAYDLTAVDMIFLCNVAAPSADVVKKLEDYVAGGGGLVFFFGNQVEPSRYNEMLYRGGQGLLPLALTEMAGDRDRPDHAHLADRTHPSMAGVAEVMELILGQLVLVRRYVAMAEDASAPARVIIRVKDADGSPLLVTRSFKKGTVYVCGTTADEDWATLMSSDSGVVLAQEMHRDAVKKRSMSAYNLSTEGSFQMDLNPGIYKRDVILRSMDEGAADRTYTAEVVGESDTGVVSARLTAPMAELRGLGLFSVTLQPHRGAAEKRLLTRHAPLTEGKLEKLTVRDFQRAYPDLAGKVEVIATKSQAGDMKLGGEGELWRLLALALLVSLLLESALAWRFGRR